jgi:amidase
MTDWIGRPATEIAEAVRAGEVTASEVVAAHVERISRLNAELGAFVRVRAAEAAAEAAAVDGRADRDRLPLAGVPVAVKDNVPVAGEPMRYGSAARPAVPQTADHPVVARLRAAGAVVVGLTNLPELAIYPFSDSVFGVARNPWDPRRTPGGSSGGSAAALASAMVPIAHGTDGLGSVRIPSAACGLFGIKPGHGVVAVEPWEHGWYGLSENGPLATTVTDAATMLGVMAGTTYSLAEPGRLRIAVSVRPPGPGVIVHGAHRSAVFQCADLLTKTGHEVLEDDPPYPGWLVPLLLSYWVAGPADEAGADLGGLEMRTQWHVRAGQLVQRLRPPREEDRERLREILEPFFAGHDLLLMPTLAQPCPPALRYGERSWPRSVVTALRFAPMTGVWNLAGYPAASVPVPGSGLPGTGVPETELFGTEPASAGLPGSVQLVAPPGGEQLLLSVAAQIERVQGWPRHAPAYDPANETTG